MKRLKVGLFKNKKRRNIVAVSLVGVLVVVGGTIAYNTDVSFFQNLFGLNRDIVTHTEDIPFPLTNWVPCEEKEKYITVTNVEGVDKYVRIKFRDQWKTSDNQTDLDGVKDGVTLATINFDDDWEDNWELRDDGYYYYKTRVAAGASTQPLLKSVTLSCDANFGKDNICTETATGQQCTKPSDPYEGAKYHLYIDIDTSSEPMGDEPHVIDCSSNYLYDTVACQTAETPANIDFRNIALASANPQTANGNGVNATTENGSTVYYYRGQIDNNYVIWANKCWRIVRTTASGGTKMIFYSEVENGTCAEAGQTMTTEHYSYGEMWGDDYSDVEPGQSSSFSSYTWTILGLDSWECNDEYGGLSIFGYTTSDCYDSPADLGYKVGNRERIYYNGADGEIPSGTLSFANDVTYSNGSYTLESATTVSGDYNNNDSFSDSVLQNRHYFCLNSSTTCTDVAYLVGGGMYVVLSGGHKIDDFRASVFDTTSNSADSVAKKATDYWYMQNIANYADDLEDAIYCNDRTIYYGPLGSKDQGLYEIGDTSYTTVFNAYARNAIEYDNNYHPSLDCSQRDSFTVSNTNGNGALTYKIGMLSSDEATFAGFNHKTEYSGSENYLYQSWNTAYLMSPSLTFAYPGAYGSITAISYDRQNVGGIAAFQNPSGVPGAALRPVVSLKQDKTYTGTGTRTDPYVIQ